MPPSLKASVSGTLAIFIAFSVDQVTKAIVVANAESLRASVPIAPGFNLTYLRNDGVTFGLLSGTPWWVLAALAIAVCVWLTFMMCQAANRVEAVAYGAIIGGAFGNVTDRLRFQGVTDFLDFYVSTAHWPAFNMADVFVVCGVGLLLIGPKVQQAHRTGP
ncbi:MAG: signal peptidase II [Alphaproteobacteria bacterium]|nr:signal peptidase II [Alphaproteobacteria bacterium]